MKENKKNWCLVLLVLIIAFSYNVNGQNVDVPQRSQHTTVIQQLWLANVTITYNSPSANGDTIFGNSVPHGQIWGAGDRENTTIEFLNDVKVEGQEVKAGKYGVFMIPQKNHFDLIFSKYSDSWFDTYPSDSDIVFRTSITPEKIAYKKWLSYDFIERGALKIVAAMQWGEIQVPFQIEIINPYEILLQSLTSQLKGREKFLWGAFSDAASNLNGRNIYPEVALEWINKSLELERNHINLQVKASILLKKGGHKAAVKELLYEAIPIMRNPMVFNSAIYNLIQIGDTKKAIEAAKTLTEKFRNHPRIWMFTDTLAESYLKDGNKKKALEYYKLAQSKAPVQQRSYYQNLISKIEK